MRRILSVLAALSLALTGANAQQTRSSLNAQNNADFYLNGVGAVTGPILNGFNQNAINSFGVLADTNLWSGSNTFYNNPLLSSCVGYPFSTGTAPFGCSSTIPASAITGLPSSNTVALVAGGTDNAPAIQAAITTQAALGGGVVQLSCGGTQTNPFYFSQIVLVSNVYVKGCGRNATYLTQLSGQNKAGVIGPSNFASLIGTGKPSGGTTLYGVQWTGLSELTIDGNIANNTSGDCVDLYGRYLSIKSVDITNCAAKGLWTEWGNGYNGPPQNPASFDNGLESIFFDLHIWNVNQEGIHFNGPHDAHFEHVIVAGSSQAANGAYDGVYIGPQGNGRFIDLHQYALAFGGNVAKCGVDVESSGNNFSGGSNFEGAQTPLYIGGGIDCYGNSVTGYFGQNTFDSSNLYYGTTVNGNAQIVVRSPLNVIKGLISGGNNVNTYGIEIGQNSSDNATSNSIDLVSTITNLGTVVFNEPTTYQAFNRVTVTGYQGTGPGYVNTPAASDTLSINITNAASRGAIAQIPEAVSGTFAVGSGVFGTAQVGLTCAGSTTTCYIGVGNTDGVGTDPSTLILSATTAITTNANSSGGYISGSVNSTPNYYFNIAYDQFSVPVRIPVYTIAGLPACNSNLTTAIAYVSDTASNAAPAFHGTPTGGGSTSVRSLVSCTGSSWQYE